MLTLLKMRPNLLLLLNVMTCNLFDLFRNKIKNLLSKLA